MDVAKQKIDINFFKQVKSNSLSFFLSFIFDMSFLFQTENIDHPQTFLLFSKFTCCRWWWLYFYHADRHRLEMNKNIRKKNYFQTTRKILISRTIFEAIALKRYTTTTKPSNFLQKPNQTKQSKEAELKWKKKKKIFIIKPWTTIMMMMKRNITEKIEWG